MMHLPRSSMDLLGHLALIVALAAALGAAAACTDDKPAAQPPAPSVFAPVPAVAIGPAIPAKGYLTTDLGGGAYMVSSGLHEMMFVVTGAGVIAIDAPQDLATAILPAIAEVTSQPVTHVIYSHAHKDHIGAAGIYPKTAQIIAHAETATILARANDPDRPLPTVTFAGETRYTLSVGSQTLYLDYHGNHHQPGSLFIYVPQPKVLMVIDIVFDKRWAPFKNLGIGQDIPGIVRAFDTILTYDFTALVGGHLAQVSTRDDVLVQQAYVRDLVSATRQARADIDFLETVRDVDPNNPWLKFKVWSDAVVERCVGLMPADWVSRLGGVDVFLRDNCFTMAESMNLD